MAEYAVRCGGEQPLRRVNHSDKLWCHDSHPLLFHGRTVGSNQCCTSERNSGIRFCQGKTGCRALGGSRVCW